MGGGGGVGVRLDNRSGQEAEKVPAHACPEQPGPVVGSFNIYTERTSWYWRRPRTCWMDPPSSCSWGKDRPVSKPISLSSTSSNLQCPKCALQQYVATTLFFQGFKTFFASFQVLCHIKYWFELLVCSSHDQKEIITAEYRTGRVIQPRKMFILLSAGGWNIPHLY